MKVIQRIKSIPRLAQAFAVLGAFFFAAQTWGFIHSQMSIDDEGSYLYKGLLFVRGQYEIFQDYGAWANHMPLSFFIPGAVLDLFGPSLRTARIFAFILGLLLLLGIWIVARRWGGHWWGAFAVWTMALNPAVLKIYSIMTSQVLIAAMLAWVLVFMLAEKRALWQLLAGSTLAGMLLLTRLNLAPVLPLVILYIFWQHGKRAGILAVLAIGITVIIGHAIFWPGILRLWAAWIPAGLAPFLAAYRAPAGIAFWDPKAPLDSRMISFFWGIRYHFVATIGVLATLLLWPRKSAWKSSGSFRAGVFLTVLFVILFILHGYVTVGSGIATNNAYSTSYCTFCLPTYMGFFSFTGILLIVIAAPSWRRELPIWLQGLISLLVIAVPTGIGYASFDTFGDDLATWQFPAFTHRWLRPNTLRLWKYLNYIYAISYHQTKRLASQVCGFLVGLVIWLLSGLVTIGARWRGKASNFSLGYAALVALLTAGWLLAPTRVLGAGYQSYDCDGCDTLADYDALGESLKTILPAGSTIYWQGEPSAVPLIYLPEIRIFPAQINQKFTYFQGETEILEKYGFWNQELAERWLEEADYVLVGTLYYPDENDVEEGKEIPAPADWVLKDLDLDKRFDQLDGILLPIPGYPGEYILVYQRVGD